MRGLRQMPGQISLFLWSLFEKSFAKTLYVGPVPHPALAVGNRKPNEFVPGNRQSVLMYGCQFLNAPALCLVRLPLTTGANPILRQLPD